MFLRKDIFSVVFLLVASHLALAQNGLNGVVKGKIMGETLLPDATISIGNKTAITNQSGEYLIAIKPGTYMLTVSYAGYKTIEQAVTVNACEIMQLDFTLAVNAHMSEISILGSRSFIQRSSMNTPVPVDIISASKMPKVSSDLTQQLTIVVPSFNAPVQTVGSGASMNPASLRGLSPDETLVLINGHRRYTTAGILLQYNVGYGSVCTDFNAIPSAAVENIEVLRDGAAAQYGSDAIAGVINLELKKSVGITSIDLNMGQYYKGDGKAISANINRGFQLGRKGFLHLTSNFRVSGATQRNGEYTDSTVYFNIPSPSQADSIKALDDKKILERGFSRLNHRPIGSPYILNSGGVVNGGFPVNSHTNIYFTGMLNYRVTKDKGSSVYRYPKDITTVITELYPDGFEPLVKNRISDATVIAGIEGRTNDGWRWDVSSTYGGNASNSYVSNTNNASQFAMGKSAQTSFYSGTVVFSQFTNNINFSRNFSKYFHHIKSFTVSLGGEFRMEHYRIKEGEETSWQNYAPSSGRIGGAQGIPGFKPENAVNTNRYATAAYAELEMDKNEKFLLNLAGRQEYYNDFGNNIAGKLAMRYKFSDRFLLRGSVSNGFRAPSLQQRYYSSTNQVGGKNIAGIIVAGTYRNDDDVAAAFGISPLRAETSVDASAGITSKISPHINFTLDAYWIRIRNRIILSGLIPRTYTRVAQILDSINRKDINSVRFFTNAISTTTNGMDAIVTGNWTIHRSILEISIAANFNRTNIFGATQSAKKLPDDSLYHSLLINPEERGRIEHSQPSDKIILAASFRSGKWELGSRSIHFGNVAHISPRADTLNEFLSPRIITGLHVSYSPSTGSTITIGARNLFDVYPDKLRNRANTQSGLVMYDGNSTQIGYNGGYYYLRLEFNF